jgi:sulfhydrogenase subunit beta (sulfur reductase)
MAHHWLPRSRFGDLFGVLSRRGYTCYGPQVREHSIVFAPLSSPEALPRGVIDTQEPGTYRLSRTGGARYFDWANGPQALKPLLFAPRETVWRVERDAQGRLSFAPAAPTAEKIAVIGVRSCDLAALRIHDRHFMGRAFVHEPYVARRRDLLLIAVNCTRCAATCFCVSTGDGPRAEQGFDLALTELDDGFVMESASVAGTDITAALAPDTASADQIERATRAIARAARQQTRSLPSHNLRDLLFSNLEHPRWDEVATRCLSCGNCTSVCPTCFCHREIETPRLDGSASEHLHEWDSCFTNDHSYIHGLTVRGATRERYRQWLTHKLGSWHDQYGRSGCVGCGRCITWCPTGIDITEEAWAIHGGAT